MGVFEAVGFAVAVEGGIYMDVLVGLTTNTNVFVADGGIIVGVGMNVLVAMAGSVFTSLGIGVRVGNIAPGVRKKLSQTGFVRMAGSSGSKNPLGL